MAPNISVIVPAYNAGAFITRALASVASQSLRPLEVVVVDDGSTDDTVARVADFREHSQLTVILEQQPNQGSATARNTGIRRAGGDLIAFLDADDFIHPEFLEACFAGLERYPHWAACFTDRDVVDMEGHLIARDLDHPGFQALLKLDKGDGYFELSDKDLFARLVGGNVIPMAAMFRRSAVESVGGFDVSVRFHEDRLFILRVIKQGGRLGYLNRSLGIWQRHGANKTAPINALRGHMGSDKITGKLIDNAEAWHLAPDELAAVRNEHRSQGPHWLYTASQMGSRTTIPLGWRLLREHRITAWDYLKALVRLASAPVRR